ncbi:MAG: glutathione S-transferase family protein [Pandoraea sp.]|uniref:glutathione S-transferase family protein n=1 Tax=unclassified Pandoraea TaxID=2624094 RepID=UPI001AC053A8|nr:MULTISPECIES: glutathione S-transferase family protein [unclassified Pandoraea]MBN9116271.1 glutathione S-transferase family protein [Pandoraea sp.]
MRATQIFTRGSSMIDVWGRNTSSNVAKVVWALRELDVPFELHLAGANFGSLRSEEYLSLNPNGRIPTLRDGSLVLWESNAIVRYLAARYGDGTLWPVDPGARAASDKWMDWASLNLVPALRALREAQKQSAPIDHRRVLRNSVVATVKILDASLGEGPFIAGAGLTMGDIALAPHIHRLSLVDDVLAELPAVERYRAALKERIGYRECIEAHIT